MSKEVYRVKAYKEKGIINKHYYNAISESDAIKMFKRENPGYWYLIKASKVDCICNRLVLKKSTTPDGIYCQMENWNEQYSHMPKNSTIGFYPICHIAVGNFHKAGEPIRAELNFNTEVDAWNAFEALIEGTKKFKDFVNNLNVTGIESAKFLESIA